MLLHVIYALDRKKWQIRDASGILNCKSRKKEISLVQSSISQSGSCEAFFWGLTVYL
jgi:hypothetical protein